jgi:hypothetical protein
MIVNKGPSPPAFARRDGKKKDRSMEYKNGYSRLGFGCMRLPSNFEQAQALVLAAIQGGINYFDTAYTYPGNEALLGKILAKNGCRDSIMIATKLPVYLVKTAEESTGFSTRSWSGSRRTRGQLSHAHAPGRVRVEPDEKPGHRDVDRRKEGRRADPAHRLFLSRQYRAVLPPGGRL